MSKKHKPRKLTNIRQLDESIEELDELDELAQDERIRKQPRDSQPATIKQTRRQRDKAWGREINAIMRKRRRDGDAKS